MRDFLLLVKAVYSNAFAGTRIKKGKTVVRKRTLWPLFLTSLLMAVVFAGEPIFALFAWQSMGVSEEALLSYLSAYLSAFLCYAFFSCASNNVSLFYAIDDEPFLPLPIKGGRLFLARFTLSLAYAFLYSFLPIVLTMALGGYACLLPAWGIVLSVVMAVFLVIGIDALAFVLVTLVYSLFRIPKNRSATTILSLAFSFLSFLFVLILSFAVIDGENADAISDEIQAVCSRLSFLDWTVFLPRKAMLMEDGLSILSFFSVLALCFLCVSLGVLAGNLFYRRKLVETGKKKKRKEDRNVRSEVEKAFLFSYRHPFLMQVRREFLNFRRHSNVLVSSLIGSVSMIVSMAVVIPVVLSLGEEGIPDNIVFLLVFSLVLVSLFQPYFTFASISLEGKSMLLLKTYPVKERDYLFSKVVFGTSFSFLVALIMMLTFSILKGFGALEILFSILALFAYSLCANVVSLLFGIRFAVFSFDNSLEILQRGWGPKLVSLVMFFFPLPFIGITALSSVFLPSLLFLGPLVSFLLLLLCAFLFYRLCRKEFRKLLKKDLLL